MHLYVSNSDNPHINLATEEFLLKNTDKDVIFLYINKPCLVVGKHQNTLAEVNYRFVNENQLPVIRRISGGGTVYHDEGNINFTFIKNGEEGKLVNFKSFISPVAGFLINLGVPAEIGVRNDILVNNLKVSGNAEHIYKKRTLHHGTLLFSSFLANLHDALHVEPGKYTDKAVKSVRSKVINIKEFLSQNLSTQQFFEKLVSFLQNQFKCSFLSLNDEDMKLIKNSADTKYPDWQWNYGYSPDYLFRNTAKLGDFSFQIELIVEKGLIKKAAISSSVEEDVLTELQKYLENQQHSVKGLTSNAAILSLEKLTGIDRSEILWAFF